MISFIEVTVTQYWKRIKGSAQHKERGWIFWAEQKAELSEPKRPNQLNLSEHKFNNN
jgi:hypothetical protein